MRSEGNGPEKWRTNSWFNLNDNAPAHGSVLVKDFIAKINVTTLPIDFHLFPRLKSTFTGRRFCDATDIIKNATEELKMLSQNCFQGCFYGRWQKRIVARRDYFERNVASMIVLFHTSQKYSD
jgi:hypothetical protein